VALASTGAAGGGHGHGGGWRAAVCAGAMAPLLPCRGILLAALRALSGASKAAKPLSTSG
jgi:hypothetical protein